MTSTRLALTVIFVKDVEISTSFYQHLFDFTIKHDFGENIVFNQGLCLWQKNRAQTIIFGKNEDNKAINLRKQTELYFETDEIENIWSKIKQQSNVKIIHDLKEENWGQKTLRIFDPDEFIIEIAEPMNHVVKRLNAEQLPLIDISDKTQLPINEIKEILNK